MQPDTILTGPLAPRPWAEPGPPGLELTILMPCLDEARTIGACVQQAREFLDRHGIDGEVLVVDNGSRDDSRALAAGHGARIVVVEERGYGAALDGGIAAARGRFVIMGDSDGSYDWSNLMPFVRELRAGADLVMGNRYRGGIQAGAMPFLHRYLGNPVLTALGRRFFGSDCGDFYCGQRGFSREAVLALDLRSRGMEYALEMLAKATLLDMRVVEIPITLAPDGRGRSPHLRTWRDGWRSLRFLLLYSPRWLFLYPGLFLGSAGALVGAALLARPGLAGPPGAAALALLQCGVAISLGFQLAAFYGFGKVLAAVSGLHPPSRALHAAMRRLHLEHGLVAGALLFAAGIGLALATGLGAVAGTAEHVPFASLRTGVAAALLTTLGCQAVCSSFYFSLLKLQWLARFEGREEVAAWTRRMAA
jgi:hypothetical protein